MPPGDVHQVIFGEGSPEPDAPAAVVRLKLFYHDNRWRAYLGGKEVELESVTLEVVTK